MALPYWGYSTSGDVVKHIPGRNFFEEDALGRTVITVSDLSDFMYDIEGEINALLYRLDFTVPVVLADSPYAYSILGSLNALGAAALAEEAWSTAKGDVSERSGRLRVRYNNLRSSIEKHDINLRDASGGPALAASLADSGSLDLDSAGGTRDLWFTRETAW